MELRPHQKLGIDKARESFINGNKHICLCACVASGKTLIAKTIIESALKKGSKVGFFSFRVILIEQLKSYFNEVPNITIGTLQLYGKKQTELFDLCIFDEKDMHGTKLKNNINTKRSITLSGSPVDASGNALDFDEILDIIQIPELIKLKLAKPIKVLSTSKIDTSSLKKQCGDFHKGQSFDMMEKSSIKRDLVDVYKRYCLERVTILFAVDTKHAESLKDLFIENGIKCDTTHTRKKGNDKIRKDFEDGKFNLLINVAQLTTGYDNVKINCVFLARPCSSIPLAIQCIGRGIRLNPNRLNDDCLVVDCAEVIKRTSFHPMQKLPLNKTKQTKKQKQCKTCENDLTIMSKTVTQLDEYSYKLISKYKCNACNAYEEFEDLKVINYKFCSDCGEQLKPQMPKLKETKKELVYYIVCECGFENKEKSILLTDKELKIIEHIEALESDKPTWDKVSAIIKEECIKSNYKHQYRGRLMNHIKDKKWSVEFTMEQITNIQNGNSKISKLMYVGK